MTAPHGYPSTIEIAADHPDWEINRDGHRHGPWHATRGETELAAKTPAGLPAELESQELARLQAEFIGRWRVWRTEQYWMATSLLDGVKPPLLEETPGALETRMRNPEGWDGRPLKGQEDAR
ncbi:hypothetical protein [Nocardiopsis sp. CC223A]|uniref:hypothetical protein n=1 Tax=Nocardiopsis sp. CC223A TaxID=3044051 RepID=UPI00278C3F0C|nr:hypothetical protein [Nocardiopsis sp. CC223A]